ncbi:MAG: helix-turn-helix transcriptional regulator [Chitinophagales bacterium]
MEQHLYAPALSPREVEIVELLSNGLTVKEIGESLSISYNTADTHRKRIIGKLGARNVTHAVRLAILKGLLALPGVDGLSI